MTIDNITQNIQTFKLGVDPYPQWFYGLDQDRIRFDVKEDGTVEKVEFFLTKNTQTAHIGDTIGYTGSSVIVIPAAAAKQYM